MDDEGTADSVQFACVQYKSSHKVGPSKRPLRLFSPARSFTAVDFDENAFQIAFWSIHSTLLRFRALPSPE
jgi:hypothetical protein